MNLHKARKFISASSKNSPDGAVFQTVISGKEFNQSIFKLSIPDWIPPGIYQVNSFYSIDNGETWNPLSKVDLEIEPEETEGPAQPVFYDSPESARHDREIERLSRFYESQIALIRDNAEKEIMRIKLIHEAEMKAVVDKYEYKLEIIETNHKTIESTRKELRDEIERNLRSERRFAVINKGQDEGMSLQDIIGKILEYLPLLTSMSGNPALQTAGQTAAALNTLKAVNNGHPEKPIESVSDFIDGLVQK